MRCTSAYAVFMLFCNYEDAINRLTNATLGPFGKVQGLCDPQNDDATMQQGNCDRSQTMRALPI